MQTILLVEDHPIAREPLRRLLVIEGYAVLPAASGLEALQLLHEQPLPDLVLLDLMLPRVSGIELLEAMQGCEHWRRIPVIVLTGVMAQSQLARVRELKVRTVLHKAKFGMDELLHEIRQALESPAQAMKT